jgi:hypothetical protein
MFFSRPAVLIERPSELSLRRVMQDPRPRDDGNDRIVVSKFGLDVASAYHFHFEEVELGGETSHAMHFEIRVNDVLLKMVGSLLTYYAMFAHSKVSIVPRLGPDGRFGVTATVTPLQADAAAEVLNAEAHRLGDGGVRFTLTDPRWSGQSVTLHPGKGAMEVVGVLSRSHKLTGRYSRRRG